MDQDIQGNIISGLRIQNSWKGNNDTNNDLKTTQLNEMIEIYYHQILILYQRTPNNINVRKNKPKKVPIHGDNKDKLKLMNMELQKGYTMN